MKKYSIIIPVWNGLEFTRRCINSIVEHTTPPCQLVIIDNGSDIPTADYLKNLSLPFNLTLVRNEQNLGFVKAVNQGIDTSDDNDVILLNNDTVVTEGWLGEMIDIANQDPSFGIINPSSNSLGQYPGRLSIQEYANLLRHEHGKWQELDTAHGFCMLIKREVINKLHYFDEQYGIGYLEETDFCKRANLIGYKSVRAKASYVYHESGASFKKIPQYQKMYEENLKLFYKKWGKPLRIAYIIDNLNDVQETETVYNVSLAAAQAGHRVLIFLSAKNTNFKVPNHASIRLMPIRIFFLFNCLIKLLERKFKVKDQKQIDLAFLSNNLLYKFIKPFCYLLRIKALNQPTLVTAKKFLNIN